MIADRRAAIERRCAERDAGDIVLIAGKGHEDYQIIGTKKIHFDDREVAREAIQRSGIAREVACGREGDRHGSYGASSRLKNFAKC